MNADRPREGDGVDVRAGKVGGEAFVDHPSTVCFQADEVKAGSALKKPEACSPGVVKRPTQEERGLVLRVRAHITQYLEENKDAIDQTGLADKMGYTDGAFSRIRNGKQGIGLSFINRFYKATGTSPSKLLLTNPPAMYWPPSELGIPPEP